MPDTRGNRTRIELIVDRSSSMASMGDKVVKGLNQFLRTQHDGAAADETISATLTTFDSTVEVVWEGKCVAGPTRDLPPTVSAADVRPRGTTALVDAIGQTLSRVEREAPPGEAVIVVILTDGHENSSRKYRKPEVVATIERLQQQYSWEFVFLAANQNAIETAGTFGIRAATSLTFAATAQGQEHAFAATNNLVSRARNDYQRCGQTAAPAQMFTAGERQICMV